MAKGSILRTNRDELRCLAEERLVRCTPQESQLTLIDSLRLQHELQVHQVEIELQNAELSRVRDDLDRTLEQYADLYELALVGYFTLDSKGTIQKFNVTGARILGSEPSKLVGRFFELLVTRETRSAFSGFFKKVFDRSAGGLCEVALQCQGAPPITVLIEAVVASSGQECRVALIDITQHKLAEEHQRLKKKNLELEERVAQRTEALEARIANLRDEIVARGMAEELAWRLNRLYAVLSATNKAILRTKEPKALFEEICLIAVREGGFQLAWVGLLDQTSSKVRAVAAEGATDYLDTLQARTTQGRSALGPAGRSISQGISYVCNDFRCCTISRPWRDRSRGQDLHSAASFPLHQDGRVIGALTVYSDQKDFFDPGQAELLRQMGEDISFALENMALENSRLMAERALREETAERLRAMEALREKEQLLIQQSRLAAMGEMIGNIAHQWRQPLNLLAILSQKLLLFYDQNKFNRTVLAENVEMEMQVIRNMSKTIDDFTNYFKPSQQKSDFGVQNAIHDALLLLRECLQGTQINVEIVANDEVVIRGYPNEFTQVLLNLLINAKDVLTGRGGDDPKITVSCRREDAFAVITIADNGGGIPEDIMDKIFEPYFSTKGPQGGSGIGLYMAKNIVENNMQGKLTVRNSASGAEFRIELLI